MNITNITTALVFLVLTLFFACEKRVQNVKTLEDTLTVKDSTTPRITNGVEDTAAIEGALDENMNSVLMKDSAVSEEMLHEQQKIKYHAEGKDSLYNDSVIAIPYRQYIPFWKARDSAEADVIKKTGGIVFRPEPTILAIKTEIGDTVYCIDWCVANADEPLYGRLYQLQDYLPSFKLCVIEISEPLSNTLLFLSVENGKRWDAIPGLPNLSPDGKRFITCSQVENDGPADSPVGFILWEKRGEKTVKVFEKGWSVTYAKWIDNSRIALERAPGITIESNETAVIILDTLAFTHGNWFHETAGWCISTEKKVPFAVEDVDDNFNDGVEYTDPEQVRFKVAISKKKFSNIPNKLVEADEITFSVNKYTRQLKDRFMYVRLVAIANLGQIEDRQAANALLNFICNAENEKEDQLSVHFAALALKSSRAPFEELIIDRVKRNLKSNVTDNNNYEISFADSVSYTMLELWKEITTVKSQKFLENTAKIWPGTYRKFAYSISSQIEKRLNQPMETTGASSGDSMQNDQKIRVDDIFNRIVNLYYDNAGMSIYYKPVDTMLLDTLLLETDPHVCYMAKKVLSDVERNNLWASRFLLLRSCLNSQSKRLRLWAIEKLSEEETWHSHALVKRAVNDQDEDIRRAAATAIKRKLFRQ